jgi:hypothetical protein
MWHQHRVNSVSEDEEGVLLGKYRQRGDATKYPTGGIHYGVGWKSWEADGKSQSIFVLDDHDASPNILNNLLALRARYLPSYVEWQNCFEMNKSVREGRREGGVTSELINPDGSVTMPPVASLGIMGSVTRSYAQSRSNVPKRAQGGVQSAAVKAAESEWNKLPTDELACANQKLTARGDSVPSLAKRGVLPSDARVADIRAQCLSSSSPAPSPTVAQAAQQSPQQQPSSPSQQQPSSDEQARQQEALTNLNQPVESLKTDLAASTARVAELEKGKAAAESALKQAEQARSDAQKAQHETDQARNADKAKLDAVTAQFEAYKASADANTDWRWAYAGIGGLIGLIAGLIPFLFTRWRRVGLWLHTQWIKQQSGRPARIAVTVSSKVEQAYRCGDLFERRRRMMTVWATFCGTPKVVARSNDVRASIW